MDDLAHHLIVASSLNLFHREVRKLQSTSPSGCTSPGILYELVMVLLPEVTPGVLFQEATCLRVDFCEASQKQFGRLRISLSFSHLYMWFVCAHVNYSLTYYHPQPSLLCFSDPLIMMRKILSCATPVGSVNTLALTSCCMPSLAAPWIQ